MRRCFGVFGARFIAGGHFVAMCAYSDRISFRIFIREGEEVKVMIADLRGGEGNAIGWFLIASIY